MAAAARCPSLARPDSTDSQDRTGCVCEQGGGNTGANEFNPERGLPRSQDDEIGVDSRGECKDRLRCIAMFDDALRLAGTVNGGREQGLEGGDGSGFAVSMFRGFVLDDDVAQVDFCAGGLSQGECQVDALCGLRGEVGCVDDSLKGEWTMGRRWNVWTYRLRPGKVLCG